MVHHGKFSGWFATLLICCCLVLPAAANAASVWTDLPDYPPGSTVTIHGSGWQPGETVNVLLHEEPTLNADILLTPTADESGNFATPYVIEATDLGVRYTVTATGAQSNLTATSSFTDAPSPGTAPVNPPTGGFGIDGDVQANVPTAGVGDWVPGASGSGGNVLTASGVPIVPGTTFHAIDLYDSGVDNNFAGGNKFDGNPSSEWTWVSNPVNDKEDLNNGLIHFTTSADGHTWVMVAADRLSNNGDAYIDFEFLQNTLSTTGGPTGGGFSSAGPDGGRTANDFVLTLELTKGGTSANFFVNRWEAVPVSAQAPAGFDYVDKTSLTPLGSVFAAVNATSVPVSYGAFGSTTYDVNTFAEAGIDLTALLGAIENCTSLGIKTILIKTKESQSPTATIVDFIAPIQLQKQIGLADAGLDQHKCSEGELGTAFSVTGTATPSPGDAVTSTLWTVVPGSGSASIASPSSATTNVTVTSSSVTLRFTVNTTQSCTKYDDVVLTVDPVPTCSISGPDGPLCPSTANQTYSGPAGMASYAWSISGNGTINGSTTGETVSVTAGSGCNSSFVLTLVVTNEAGCSSTRNKTVNVGDSVAPVIAGVGADHTIQCGEALDFSSPTASDNCGTASLVPNDVSTPGSCLQNHDVTRTWTATDGCNNSVTASQTIHVVDTTVPTLVGVPSDANYQCASEVPEPPVVTATDSCDPNPGVVFAHGIVILDGANTISSVGSTCAYHFDRTWTATDACGNSVSATQTIHVHDTTNPVITGVGLDHAIQCGEALDFSSPTASDNCGTASLVPNDVSTPGSCLQNHDVTRTWTATDACGNSVTASQTIHVVDTTVPTLVGVPSDANYQCASEVPEPPVVTATDSCDPNPGVVFAHGIVILDGANTISSVGSTCAYHFDRTWTATDACGNSVSATQTIHVHDTTNPVITGVGLDHAIQCGEALDFSSPTASDNCGTASLVPNDVSTPGSCLQNHDVTRTWTATDACGNSVTASQTIHVVDTTAPTLVGAPVDASYQCANEVPEPPVVTATDSCDPNPGVVFAHGIVILDGANTISSVGSTCAYHFDRTWTATDACGNSVSATQTIHVHDTTNPVITGVGLDHAIQCGEALDFSSPTASDNCGTASLVPNDVSTPGSCLQNHDVTRTWTATDACGNSVTASQTIHVVDTTAPTLVGAPVDASYQCANEVPEPPVVTATDSCDPNPGVVFAHGIVILDGANTTNSVATVQTCSYHFDRTWTATDHCGNSVSATQTIHVHDTTAPSITCPDPITVGACQPVNFAATGSDNCGGLVTFSYDPEPGTTFALGTTTVHVTGSDFCGNTASCDFTVTVTPSPTVTVTGVDQICQGGFTEFCGPDGNYDYAWTGPGGFAATTKCTGHVSAQGKYTLVITDKSNTCQATGDATLTVNPLPACSITGKTETCANVAVDLCGPDGNLGYVWSGPGGFSATGKCISVSTAGDYTLTTTDLGTKCSSSSACSAHLTVNQCVTNCPRTPGFWAAQCDQSPTGKSKFDSAQMDQITSRVDDKVGIFNWTHGADFSRFCATVDKSGGSMDQRQQAKRQFAAFLANVCTGELGLIANNGDIIKLDLSTPVSCPALSSTTLGGLITEVDNLLLTLEAQSLTDPVVKAKYSQVISCLNDINNAEGVGTVCSAAQQQNALYQDYVSSAAISDLPGDLVELYRPSPNPFANSTRIAYVVNGKSQQVEVGIFDIAGRRVRQLANGFQAPGRYELNWDGRSDAGEHVVNGVYFIRSIVAGHVKSMQVVLLK